jgi:hypothetical protein
MAWERTGGGAGALGDFTAVLGMDILQMLLVVVTLKLRMWKNVKLELTRPW